MSKGKFDFWRLINPATDLPALLAVLLGLGIAVFLDDLAIKLIGVCVSALGGLALFLMISQRLKDLPMGASKTVASETKEFKTTVKEDKSGKRLVFDDYVKSFGDDDAKSPVKTTATGMLSFGDNDIPDLPVESDENKESSTVKPVAIPVPTPIVPPKQTMQAAQQFDDSETNDEDFSEGIRILGPVQKVANPEKVSDKKVSTPSPISTEKKVETKVAEKKEEPKKASETKAKEEPKKADVPTPESEKNIGIKPTVPTPEKHVAEMPHLAGSTIIPPLAEATSGESEDKKAEASEKSEPIPHKRKKLNVQLTEIFEETPNSLRNEPRKEFDYLLSRVLLVIRSVISARTAAFLWVNFEKRELVLESYITDAAPALRQQRKLPLGNDVISQIALNGAPEILMEINPSAELDLIPYYAVNAATRSFVGVPVYFNSKVVGILTADSNEEDAYDSSTVSFLGYFTKLISGLVQGYTDKYDLLQSARALESLDQFRKLMSGMKNTKDDIGTALLAALDNLISATSTGICMYDDQSSSWKLSRVQAKQSTSFIAGKEVDLERSLIGKTIFSGKTFHYSNIPPDMMCLVANEKRDPSSVFVFVPLKSFTRCYGALFVEVPHSAPLTQLDGEIIEMLAEYAGTTLEQMELNTILQLNSLLDEATGIFNAGAYTNRLQEEFLRAQDSKSTFSILLINIDQYASLSSSPDSELAEINVSHVVQQIQKHLRPYDIIGRVSDHVIGVGLIQKKSDEAKFWGERVRKEIASSVLHYATRQYTVTVSIGAAQFGSQQSLEELSGHAQKALDLALQKTNAVHVFA